MDATHGESGHGSVEAAMDMPAHRAMFAGFIKTTEWSIVGIAMLLALTVFAFALGLGWWTGLIAWAVIGVAAGALLNMGGVWWAFVAVSTVVLGVGGAITMGLQSLT
jgi:Bacterial aa3 type cytochrome c oxidase subunit IV